MDPIKNSFSKVKRDIDELKQEISNIEFKIAKNNNQMLEMCKIIKDINKKIVDLAEKQDSTQKHINQTLSTHISTHRDLFKALKHQNLGISTRNEGASTDRQTDRQTHRQTQKTPQNPRNKRFQRPIKQENQSYIHQKNQITMDEPENQENKKKEGDSVKNAADILDSLDNIKKEIRHKFKRLTDQEFSIFSSIYQLDEEKGYTTYKTLAQRLNLSESSIRDYVRRVINKGIPLEKTKINNKSIRLSISSNLKKIAKLPTIMKLRDI